jgi:hypothetical protein
MSAMGPFATDALGVPLGTMSGVPQKPTLGSSAASVAAGNKETSEPKDGESRAALAI